MGAVVRPDLNGDFHMSPTAAGVCHFLDPGIKQIKAPDFASLKAVDGISYFLIKQRHDGGAARIGVGSLSINGRCLMSGKQ